MKKIIVAMLLMACACSAAMAQNSVFNNPDNKAYFGVRFAPEVACPGDVKMGNVSVDMFDNGGGFEFGGIYNIPLVANLYIEPGVKLYYNTYSINKDYLDAFSDDMLGMYFDSATIKKFGMRIPVMAGYHFDFTDNIKVYAFTGPELEIGFTAKETVKSSFLKETESIYGSDGALHRVNLLWGIGAGVSYKNYYFGVSGGIGMVNMFKDSGSTFHENRVTFTLGYNF